MILAVGILLAIIAWYIGGDLLKARRARRRRYRPGGWS